jgi:hypothetical protein
VFWSPFKSQNSSWTSSLLPVIPCLFISEVFSIKANG